MKTLYVSDLDGTLLQSDERTSDYTNRVINQMTEKGILFSYVPELSTTGMKKFTDSRKGDIRENPVGTPEDLKKGEPFYFTCIDEPAKWLEENILRSKSGGSIE